MSASKKKDKISIEEAIEVAEKKGVSVTKPTVITWCDRYKQDKLGSKLGGRWYVDRKNFEDFLDKGLGE